MLVVKVDVEKDKENYQAVVRALEAFDIASVAWEDDAVVVDPKIRGSADSSDLGAAVSSAVDRMVRRGRGL